MDIVLDLDLDFFVWPVTNNFTGQGRVPPRDVDRIASASDVRRFLEEQCHLSQARPLVSRQIRDHDEAFFVWQQWIADGLIRQPFRVVHVDAHSDLDTCGNGYLYLTRDLLALPLEQRGTPRRGLDAMNEGNYLAFAIANRWIAKLEYVYPVETVVEPAERETRLSPPRSQAMLTEPNDVGKLYFHRMDPQTRLVELKHYQQFEWSDLMAINSDNWHWREPDSAEPPVPFEMIAASTFNRKGFTHLIIAESPPYTPEAADTLLPVIAEYGDVSRSS